MEMLRPTILCGRVTQRVFGSHAPCRDHAVDGHADDGIARERARAAETLPLRRWPVSSR